MSAGRFIEAAYSSQAFNDLSPKLRANLRALANGRLFWTGGRFDPSQSPMPNQPSFAYRFHGWVGISSGRPDDLAKPSHSDRLASFNLRAKARASTNGRTSLMGEVRPAPSQSLQLRQPL